jgi:hypothetical protein
MIEVINIKKVAMYRNLPDVLLFYIGRKPETAKANSLIDATVFGNSYLIGRDGTREEVIEKYRMDEAARWELMADYHFLIEALAIIAKEKNVILVCHCKPLACHGDVLKARILTLLG